MSKKRLRTVVKRDPKTVAFWSFMAAALVIGAGMFWLSESRTPPATAEPAYVSPTTVADAPPTITLPANPKALFFGDSFTFGTASTPRTLGYAYRTGELLGWTPQVEGVSGTGFVNPGPPNATYQLRLDSLPLIDRPSVVVLQGGVNDQRRSNGEIFDAATKAIQTLRDRIPGVQIVMFGPVAGDPLNIGSMNALVEVNSTLRNAAGVEKVPYVDALSGSWITATNAPEYIADDRVHPTTAGHQYLADRLAAAIREVTVTG